MCVAKDLLDHGIPVVPIIPKGKSPGTLSFGRWFPMEGWRRFRDAPPDEETLASWSSWIGEAGAGVGVPTGEIVAIDLDAMDPYFADEAQRTVESVLGKTRLVRIGRNPKRLLVYRTRTPIRKLRSATWDFDGQPCSLEILGDGQQFVAYGTHPITGRPYQWVDLDLASVEIGDIPIVEPGALRAAVAAFDDTASLLGGIRVTRGSDAAGERESGDPEGDLSEIVSAVRHTPNDAEHYDDWLRMGIAIKRALPDNPDEAFTVFDGWSSKSGKYDPQVTRDKWESIDLDDRSTTVGARTVYMLARQSGWDGRGDASTDFEPITDEEEAEAKEPLVFARPSDFADRDPPPREWFLDGLIPKGKVTLLSGDGGVGKTLVALQTMTAAAAGQPQWFGRKIQSCKVLGVFSEDDTDELWRRQADICRETDAQMRDLDGMMWWSADHVASTGCVLMTFNNQHPAGRHTAFFKKLERAIAEQRPGLVVLDPAANMFGGNEIDRSQVTGFINRALNYLCVTYGVTILLLTHPSVAGMSEGTGRSGSTGWSNAVRSRLYLTRTEGDTTGDYRTLKTTKANYGKFGEEIVLQWRRGTFQAVVGTDSDPELAANRALILAFKILAERGDTSSHSSRASNYLVAQAMKMPEVKGFGRTALEAALERLLRAGTFKVEQIKGVDRHPRPQLALVEGDEFDRPENVNFD